jgi:hypothetical protein
VPGDVGDARAVRPQEVERAVPGAVDGEAVLVEEAVVVAAEQDEVVLAGRAAVRPVVDVVGVEVVASVAAGVAAAAVAAFERGAQWRWDDAPAAAVVDATVAGVACDLEGGVAGQASGGL